MTVTGHKWLAPSTLEIRFEKPSGFSFVPGQKVRLVHDRIDRIYSLTSRPQDNELAICVRHIPNGRMTSVLADTRVGQLFHLTPAFGFFVFQPSSRLPVFVATGTGIAPFVAFARSGVRGFYLLHGVRHAAELYYRELLAAAAGVYVPCLSDTPMPNSDISRSFHGRVTAYIEVRLPAADYDFYLCGRGEMVRDAMRIIDRRYPAARVFTETFF